MTYNRKDLTEILPLVDAYWQRHAELRAAGKYPYHAEFYDLVPDAERPETPIYMLSQLFSLVQGHEQEAECRAQGMDRLLSLSGRMKFKRVVVFAWHFVGAGSYERYEFADARVIPGNDGKPEAILRKGKRTHGVRLYPSAVVYVSPEAVAA